MFFIGRQGEVNIINEAGLYPLILRSNKPEAMDSDWNRFKMLLKLREIWMPNFRLPVL
jgi:hypothetical protein